MGQKKWPSAFATRSLFLAQRFHLVFIAAMLLSLSACQSRRIDLTLVGPPVSSVSFSADVLPLFTTTCGGSACHVGQTTNGVNLSSYNEVVASISFQYGGDLIVVPGDALASPLFDKLTPTPQFGIRMPSDVPLNAAQVNMIRVWIDEGALDN